MGRFGSELYHGCLNAPKKKLHPSVINLLDKNTALWYSVLVAAKPRIFGEFPLHRNRFLFFFHFYSFFAPIVGLLPAFGAFFLLVTTIQ